MHINNKNKQTKNGPPKMKNNAIFIFLFVLQCKDTTFFPLLQIFYAKKS